MKRLPLILCLMLPLCVCAEEAAPFLLNVETVQEKTLNKAIRAPIKTIVEKSTPSPSGDPHDYISYGRYFWPDPSKSDGLPYIKKDGHPNRELIVKGDGKSLDTFEDNIELLALGWSQSHSADASLRAGEWLRAWLVNPDTKMKPSFEYAQIQLGHNNNRGSSSGLIDTRGIPRIVDAVRLLHGSPGLSTEDEKAIKAWFADYLNWLLTSSSGQSEHKAKNNHGSWYLMQVIAISRFLGRDDEAKALAREDLARIDWQIEPDGRQPLETARADGLSYSIFNLDAQLRIARLVQPLGVDLWNYTAPKKGSLKKALAYLKPYSVAPDQWPHGQLAKLEPGFLKRLEASVAILEEKGAGR